MINTFICATRLGCVISIMVTASACSGKTPTEPIEPVLVEDAISNKITLSNEQIANMELITDTVMVRDIAPVITRPGEVTANRDRLVEVSPGFAGFVRNVHVNPGDPVSPGSPLATLESTELAGVEGKLMNANDLLALAQGSYEREKRLWEQQITSEESYLESRRAVDEARINQRTAQQAARALGISGQRQGDPVGTLTVRAPISGTVMTRAVAPGQQVAADTPMFMIADLSEVWVNVRLYPEDLRKISTDAPASIRSRSLPETIVGHVRQVVPNLDESTRTALALVVVENTDRILSTGQFVDVELQLKDMVTGVIVPDTAIAQAPSGMWQVFVETSHNVFEPIDVVPGARAAEGVIVSGLPEGATVVTEGAFFLRAELDKGSLADDD